MTAVLPHRTLDGPAELGSRPCFDGVPRPDRVEGHLRRIDLTGVGAPGWEKLTLEVVVERADEDVARSSTKACTVVTSSRSRTCDAPQTGGADESGPRWRCRWTRGVSSTRMTSMGRSTCTGCPRIWTGTVPPRSAAPILGRLCRRGGASAFPGTFQVSGRTSRGRENPAVPENASSESFFVDLASARPRSISTRTSMAFPSSLRATTAGRTSRRHSATRRCAGSQPRRGRRHRGRRRSDQVDPTRAITSCQASHGGPTYCDGASADLPGGGLREALIRIREEFSVTRPL